MQHQKPTFTQYKKYLGIAVCAVSTAVVGCSAQIAELPTDKPADEKLPVENASPANVKIRSIPVEPANGEDNNRGGLIATDVDGDQQLDILITKPNVISAYSLTKGKLWKKSANLNLSEQAESEGLPGNQGPGIQAGDIDKDGSLEVLYLTPENTLEVLAAESGALKYRAALPPVDSTFRRWEHAILANFKGNGDSEILLQASQKTNKEDYIRDSIQAAFEIKDLLASGAKATPLWLADDFVSLSHGSAKIIDIDQDGKDEVIGATILSPEGKKLYAADIDNTSFPHADSIAIDDIDPSRPGLEAVIPEESGRKRVILFDEKGTIWRDRHREKSDDLDGDKVAIGNFDPDRAGLEMWFRGDESAHFTVLDASRELIASYKFKDRQPPTWTSKGFEVINRIRWTGEAKDYIVAKERHESGDVGIFDAITGQLIAQFPAQAERLYVADIVGDWREEIIVLEKDRLQVIQNAAPNPNPNQPRLWEQAQYRRQKMTWNYYSP